MKERLQKLIARAGIASRRAAEKLISDGQVTVNGKVVTEMGTKADPEKDHIKVRGRLINPKIERVSDVYILLNKPKGVLSSVSDPENRKLVTDLVPKSVGRVFPVGRLDFNTEGLIILTNDGEFANRVASKNNIPKKYEVKVKGIPPENAIGLLRRGVDIGDGGRTMPAEIRQLNTTKTNAWFEVILHEGRNQQIRKMFDTIGFSAVKLRRVGIGGLTLKGLAPGNFRHLTEDEIARLNNPRKR